MTRKRNSLVKKQSSKKIRAANPGSKSLSNREAMALVGRLEFPDNPKLRKKAYGVK